MKALIDGDLVTFRAAFTAEDDPLWIATARTDKIIEDILVATECSEYEVWLTGKNNFRYNVYPEYKANRLTQKRPKWEIEVKNHLVNSWNANWTEGCEADDILGVRQCMSEGTIIASIDKDMRMIPGWHYNFVRQERFQLSDLDAIKFFYTQLLTGDITDNIKGVPGIGPKKAEKILVDLTTEVEMFNAVRDTYGIDEEMEMNALCLWIWRKMNDNIIMRWKEQFDYEAAVS